MKLTVPSDMIQKARTDFRNVFTQSGNGRSTSAQNILYTCKITTSPNRGTNKSWKAKAIQNAEEAFGNSDTENYLRSPTTCYENRVIRLSNRRCHEQQLCTVISTPPMWDRNEQPRTYQIRNGVHVCTRLVDELTTIATSPQPMIVSFSK